MNFVPTNYFRWSRNDTVCPTRRLEQWWTLPMYAWTLEKPEQCSDGEWREVPDAPPRPQPWD